ncbi:MAG TPA: multicopper oxidase family protein [Anaerovoracaceae bacterium]|nr:multicopper oxidase family protein [Anaerovoracaceae bacterium]
MSGKLITVLSVTASIVLILTAIVWFDNNQMNLQTNSMDAVTSDNQNEAITESWPFNDHSYSKNLIQPKEGQPVKNITLIAQERVQELSKGLIVPVWTYNGTVPGAEIRVKQGDFVQVELFNNLKEPITIHWHGYPVISAMDGIPGITQDSIMPGESFTYQFSADIPGTYWYHSHQEGSKQVDKGLYGALIVEPKDGPKIDKDYTLILDEWMSNPVDDMGSMSGMSGGGMDNMSGMSPGTGDMGGKEAVDLVMQEEQMMASLYDIYTVNGKSGEIIDPLNVKKGDVVRLRFINAGYRTHGIHIPGQDIKVVSTDGQTIQGAGVIKDKIITIAPGERYDVEFTVNTENGFFIDAHDANKYNDQLKIPVNVIDGSGKVETEASVTSLPNFDLLTYGEPALGAFTLDQKYDIDYRVELDTDTSDNSLKYTINGKVFSDLPPLHLKKGQLVKFTFENKSIVDHPMHLHGHFFQLLSKNGEPFTGAVIMKDTLLVKPGEEYIVAFIADNPGDWVQHCHELHHAAAGMMQEIIYDDFMANYYPDPQNPYNKPE